MSLATLAKTPVTIAHMHNMKHSCHAYITNMIAKATYHLFKQLFRRN